MVQRLSAIVFRIIFKWWRSPWQPVKHLNAILWFFLYNHQSNNLKIVYTELYTSRKEVSVLLTGFLSIKSATQPSHRNGRSNKRRRKLGDDNVQCHLTCWQLSSAQRNRMPDDTSGHTPDYHIYNITRVSHFHINT